MNGKPTRTHASLTVRVTLIVMAVLLGVVSLLAVTNLAAVGNYNHATQTLQENIKTSKQDTVDWDKLKVKQQQTDAQFDDAGAMRALLLPQLRESIDYNSHVSDQFTKSIIRKTKSRQKNQSGSNTNTGANMQPTDGTKSKAETKLTDAQRKKVEELLKQNAQSTQSDTNANGSGSAANQNMDKSSSQTKPW